MFRINKKHEDKMLSIVIPSYNHEKYIGKAIESVLNQTYSNWELIIVDDGSSDKSLSIIHQYNDSRIQVIEQENQGAHNAINRGLSVSKGDYLAILNSDDVYDKKRFEIMIHKMEAQKELQFLCSYLEIIDTNGKSLGIKKGWENMPSWTIPHTELSLQAADNFNSNILVNNFVSTTSNFLFTKNLYKQIGGMRNLRYAHDWDFALRAAEVVQCEIINKPLIKYRVHETNTISTNRKWMLFEIAWIWAANLNRYYKFLFGDNQNEKNIVRLIESLNLQGNDKILWALLVYIEAQKAKGIIHPEEIFLNDEKLRNRLLEYIND